MPNTKPTLDTAQALQKAYNHFNRSLFKGELPECIVTVQRKPKAKGYFSPDRWENVAKRKKDQATIDEIALNPDLFKDQPVEETMSTLVHEQVHLWQQHFGNPSTSHHNVEWADKMETLGLMPSNTGLPGGKRTGQQMTHYIMEGGKFQESFKKLAAKGFELPWVTSARDKALAKKKAASKTKFTCPDCEANAWGKPDLNIECGDCGLTMEPND